MYRLRSGVNVFIDGVSGRLYYALSNGRTGCKLSGEATFVPGVLFQIVYVGGKYYLPCAFLF